MQLVMPISYIWMSPGILSPTTSSNPWRQQKWTVRTPFTSSPVSRLWCPGPLYRCANSADLPGHRDSPGAVLARRTVRLGTAAARRAFADLLHSILRLDMHGMCTWWGGGSPMYTPPQQFGRGRTGVNSIRRLISNFWFVFNLKISLSFFAHTFEMGGFRLATEIGEFRLAQGQILEYGRYMEWSFLSRHAC